MPFDCKNRWAAAALFSCVVGLATASVRARRAGNVPDNRTFATAPRAYATRGNPTVVLWAWERPEDLRFLASQENVGVAFLAGTVELRQTASHDGGGVTFQPRQQPLKVDAATPLMAVVRIESSHDLWHKPSNLASATATTWYSDKQREQVADLIASAAQLPRVGAIQIDFDASESEQPFYAVLLQDVRHRLPRSAELSITALASWCISDPWLNQLPAGTINEAVPMLFRMGSDAQTVTSFVASRHAFVSSACRNSLGVSTDEAFSRGILDGTTARIGSKRVYVFSSGPWKEKEATKVVQEAER